MTNLKDIHSDNSELWELNPELAKLFNPQKQEHQKVPKFHNVITKDLNGETYGSGLEADHSAKFVQSVKSGENLVYVHHLVVNLPGGVKMELDHFIVNGKLQPEVYETKARNKKTGRLIMTRDWRNKQKQFEDIYGIKIQILSG
jgi:hypothetical protein